MSHCLDLDRFADGELEPEHAAAFREHLRTCEACQAGLVEAMHLRAQLSTMPPRPPVQPGVTVPVEPPAWKWRAKLGLASCGILASAATATVVLWPVAKPIQAFAKLTTRPYEVRLAYADAASHRPPRDVSLGTVASAPPEQRIPYDVLGALQARGDRHGLAIARAWNHENLGEVIKELGALPPTPSVRSDHAAFEVLTTSADNLEPVLAELEALRDSGEVAAARAARWNYALLLVQLDLPLGAAQAFRAIEADHEPGWAEEAGKRAALLEQRGQDFDATWHRASEAGTALIASGEPVPSDLIQARPGLLRALFYNAVRAAPSRERVLALSAMAAELDRFDAGHALSDYVQRVAKLDFRRRAPLASAYADLALGKSLAARSKAALTSETASADVVDIVMGAMIELEVVADHGAWFGKMAAQSGDPWFAIVLDRAEAEAAIRKGDWPGTEAHLRAAEARCTPGLSYQCLTIARRLGWVYAELQRVQEALTVLRGGVRAARRTGEWGRYRALLWQLADTERFHSATATVRAYGNELLLMGTDCGNRGQTHHTLAGAAIIDVDGRAARRHLTEALQCEQADLRTVNQLVDIARLDPQPGDLAQIQEMLRAARASGTLSAPERVLADEIEGRLVVGHDRPAGIALLEKAIAEADRLPGEVIADKARAAAFAVLAFDAARARDYTRALDVVARDLGLSPPGACAVAMAAEDERAVVVVRGADGKDRGVYDHDRRRSAGALTVPDPLPRDLAGCARVRVMAPAALQGQPRVLPPDLAWSYASSARGRVARPTEPPAAPHTLIVTNVVPPGHLGLQPLSIQPPAPGSATTLSGPDATPTRVLAAMANATEIQFHTHALMDVGVSDASHLVLSPDPDGRYALTTEAIRRIQLRGHPVVVLAACHSARGARYQHAPWSLPDAFVAVGARGVFATATEIPDVESTRFFASVLARVRAGADPAAALRDQRVAPETRASTWVGDVILFE